MNRKVDVIVIGSGIVGSAAAYHLASRGCSVAVFEKGSIASEASGQSTAAVRVQGRHRSEIPMMLDCIEMWKTLDGELHSRTDFVQGGNLYVTENEADVKRFSTSSAEARRAGLESRMLARDEVNALLPAMSRDYPVLAGMYSPNDGYAGNFAATRAFARAAVERGAKVHEGVAVYSILTERGRVKGAETTAGRFHASNIVVAAGVWSRILSAQVGVRLPIRIASVTCWETTPVPQLFSPMIRAPRSSARPLADGRLRISDGYNLKAQTDLSLDLVDNLRLWYRSLWQFRNQARFRVWPKRVAWDLMKTFRSRHPGAFPTETTPPEDRYGRRSAIGGLTAMFPQLKGVQIQRAVTGMLDLMPDMRPSIGPAGPMGAYFAAGFSGHGFAMGPVVGKILADLVTKGRCDYDLDPFSPQRFSRGSVDAPVSWL